MFSATQVLPSKSLLFPYPTVEVVGAGFTLGVPLKGGKVVTNMLIYMESPADRHFLSSDERTSVLAAARTLVKHKGRT